ncbi:MAG: FAD-binding oxidoreductase [Candidatus Omnitrophica bacterium]|nr:FAD-binding oxidoreductase [Candidatus Omnitrophota bacterium]
MTNSTEYFFTNIKQKYPDYLRDESRLSGSADSISFPKTETELKEHIASARKLNRAITIQGARTGITGGAVPKGGHILNLSQMNNFLGLRHDCSSNSFFITVQPGVLFSEIQQAVKTKQFNWADNKNHNINNQREKRLEEFRKKKSYFFPPDITETSATIGGMVACNASGAESFFYGPTRNYIERFRLILADGNVLDLKRGEHKVENRCFSVKTDSGRTIEGTLPFYKLPQVKNASGYFVKENMDLLDLFVGSEGTLGIISEVEIRLIPAPSAQWVVVAFFESEDNSISFVKKIRESKQRPVAIEFFDSKGLNLFRKYKDSNTAFQEIPDIPQKWNTAVYLEFHGESEDVVESAVTRMSEIMSECGANTDDVWLGYNERDITRLKNFRHAIPETINMLIDERRRKFPELTKLGTDMAVPDEMLKEVIKMYHKGLKQFSLEYVIFGHIADNHLHVNIIPNNFDEYERGKKLYLEWAQAVVKMGGTVSAEHGIGKLKIFLLQEMYGEQVIRQMQQVKRLFDPDGVLNPGNLFGDI